MQKFQKFINTYNFELLYKRIFIGLAAMIVVFIPSVIKFRQFCEENGMYVMKLSTIMVSFIYMINFMFIKYLVKRYTFPFFHKYINDKYQGEDREARAFKMCKWAYDILYYSLNTITAYIIFKDADWYPYILGGKGGATTLFDSKYPDYPVGVGAEYMETLYILQCGNHLLSLFELFFGNRKKYEEKFYEWLLHHFIAVNLIFFSGAFNQFPGGTLVLVIHDYADVSLCMMKMYCEFQFKKEKIFQFLVAKMLFVWMMTRMIAFPYYMIYTSFTAYPSELKIWPEISTAYFYMLIQMLFLYMLHSYWFSLMIVKLYELIKRSNKDKELTKVYHNTWDFHNKLKDKNSKAL